MLLVMVFFASIFFIITDIVPICQNKQWKLLCVYSAFMILFYVLSILLTIGIEIPSPAKPLENAVSAIFGEKLG